MMELIKAGKLDVENVDVFCEKGAFSLEQSRQILEAARKNGLKINFHGEELVRLNSAEVYAVYRKPYSSPLPAGQNTEPGAVYSL